MHLTRALQLESPKYVAMDSSTLTVTQENLNSSPIAPQQHIIPNTRSPILNRLSIAQTHSSSPLAPRQKQVNLRQGTMPEFPTPSPKKQVSAMPKTPQVESQLSKVQEKEAGRLAHEAPFITMDKIKLSKRKTVDLLKAKEQRRLNKNIKDVEEDVVLCECGDSDEDGDMVITFYYHHYVLS